MIQRLLDSLPPPDESLLQRLNDAASVIADLDLPMHTDAVSGVLERRFGAEALSAAAVVSACAAAGIDTGLRCEESYVLEPQQIPPDTDQLLTRVKKRVRLNGFFCCRELGEDVELPAGIETAAARSLVANHTGLQRVQECCYVSSEPDQGGRLAWNSKKMLAVTSPMRVAQLAAGLDRQTRVGRMPLIPGNETLGCLVRAIGFHVVDGLVDLRKRPTPKGVLSDVEYKLFTWLDSSDLRTARLRRYATEADVPARTLAHYLSYSPIIESRGRGVWGLRGRKFERSRLVSSSPQVSYSWSTDGKLVLQALIGTGSGVVVEIPEPVRPMLSERYFTMKSGAMLSIRDGHFVLMPDEYTYMREGRALKLSFDLADSSLVIQ